MKKLLFFLFILPATLLVTSCDDDDDSPAISPNAAITSFIETNYPGAVVTSVERSANGLIEVEVVHDSVKKEVYFNRKDEWVFTEWDVLASSLPQAVVDAINAQYPEYTIDADDVEYVQTPTGDYYSVNVERGNFEKDLNILPDGNIID